MPSRSRHAAHAHHHAPTAASDACPVVILCGGMGTRLREKTVAIPKPLLGVGAYPLVWHVMKTYEKQGFRRFVLCLGYKGKLIEEYFTKLLKKREYKDWNVTLAHTGLKTPTGGRLHAVGKHLDSDRFMLTYADGLANVDCQALLRFHKKHGKTGTLTATRPRSPFGELKLQPKGVVERFAEKPVMNAWINGGFFVFERGFLDRVKSDDVLEQAPLVGLAGDRELVAFKHEGFWKCVDTYKDLTEVNETWKRGDAPWKNW
jgi:glucose-1-phosphate cytidylyltransferase